MGVPTILISRIIIITGIICICRRLYTTLRVPIEDIDEKIFFGTHTACCKKTELGQYSLFYIWFFGGDEDTIYGEGGVDISGGDDGNGNHYLSSVVTLSDVR